MSGPVVVYLERAAGGVLFRKVRLLAQGAGSGVIDRTWTSPSLAAGTGGGEDGATGAGGNADAVHLTRAAARWVAEAMTALGVKKIAYVCVDPEGAVCTWLSSTSADPSVINAALMQPDAEGEGTGGAARLLALGAGGGTGASAPAFSPDEASVQALATMEPPAGDAMRRERMAVLAVPDAPVRVFLDELDSRNIEVEQVLSLWHAMALTWDPAGPAAGRESVLDDLEPSGRVVATSSEPGAAVLLVDPLGRLVWAWSRTGRLVAGGSMRLKTVHAGGAVPEAEAGEPGTRRIRPEEAEQGTVVEFTEAESGRLAIDWLSWSAQLGHCPQRVACIGPGAADAGSTHADPAVLGRALARAWPGATIAIAAHADPIGATLLRLAGVDAASAAIGGHAGSLSDDPRAALLGLTTRPGRLDRWMHGAIAAGVAAIALGVGVLGYKFHRSATGAAATVTAANNARTAALDSIDPNIKLTGNAKSQLEAEITKLQKQLTSLGSPPPVLKEVSRALNAIEGSLVDDDSLKIINFEVNSTIGRITLEVADADVGPEILGRIRANPDLFMRWEGSTPGAGGGNPGARRTYVLTAIAMSDKERAGAAGSGKP